LEIVLAVGNIAETVTVTATRTQISTDDIAISVSVVSREQLEQKTLNTIAGRLRYVSCRLHNANGDEFRE